MNQLQNIMRTWLDRFLVPIDDPTSRLFYLNILFAIAFIFVWLIFSYKKIRALKPRFLKLIFFSKKYWWNKSTQFDFKIYILNSFLKVLIFIPFLDFSFELSLYFLKKLQSISSSVNHLELSFMNLLLFTISFFVFDDFIRFIHHYLMHKIPWLWKFHKTHHSATTLTPLTLYRTHPIESAIATVRNSFSLSIATSFFVFLFQSELTMVTLFGVNFFGFLFNLLGSNLRHSHIPISFGALENIFISPKQHQIHHSADPAHFDKNFGVSLSIWDILFKSHLKSKSIRRLKFGNSTVEYTGNPPILN
jgi:sterol desaturase/sphingolipid hydroxylase (fatty acid hydroxylase superfamily)